MTTTTRQTKTTTAPKTPAKRRAAKAAPPEAPAARESRTWDATATESHTCAGACGETKPAKAYPTTGKEGHRGVECRSCRDARKVAA